MVSFLQTSHNAHLIACLTGWAMEYHLWDKRTINFYFPDCCAKSHIVLYWDLQISLLPHCGAVCNIVKPLYNLLIFLQNTLLRHSIAPLWVQHMECLFWVPSICCFCPHIAICDNVSWLTMLWKGSTVSHYIRPCDEKTRLFMLFKCFVWYFCVIILSKLKYLDTLQCILNCLGS